MASHRTQDTFPPGLSNAYLFALFNALSFPMMIGSPMVLYAQSLGATATVLGIVVGMMPLLVIFQIPAASHIPRIGYKRFVMAGWGTRVAFIFCISVVPLTGVFLTPTTQLVLVLSLLFCFNLSRGISSCAWLPWIAGLVPESIRGGYLSRDAACVSVASLAAFLVAALCLGTSPAPWQFSALFAFSACAGAISLLYLRRIPDVPIPDAVKSSREPVPYREIARFEPFRKLLCMNLAWGTAYGGLAAFTVAYLKSNTPIPESGILLVMSASYIGGLSSLWFLGSRLDRLGSRPVLMFSLAAWVIIIAAWFLIAAGVFPPATVLLVAIQLAMGLANALVNMANTRLAMLIAPAMGRDHFFAIFSVVANVTLGIAPVLWGFLIDAIGDRHATWHGLEWNRYSIFFALVAASFVVALLLARRLEEPKAGRFEDVLREVLIASPQRLVLRLMVRLWPRGGGV
jgi:MFS family permease